MKSLFDHEKLAVYQSSLRFIEGLEKILRDRPKNHAVIDQLDRASTSVPLNIAEGNGRYTSKDRCRFFDMARGSALECAACLDVLKAKGLVEENLINPEKERVASIVSMLVGLIKSNSKNRVHEGTISYGD